MVPDPQADQGEHEFIFSLYPHEGDWLQGGTVQAAWSLNNPVKAVYGKPEQLQEFSLFTLCPQSAKHVMIDVVKKAEDRNAIVLRLHEFAGMRGTVTLTSGAPILNWQETNLMERPSGELYEAGEITFEINPYEIKTITLLIQE
ncbi:hypothetical protein D3C73_809610 [compost metagenome]